MTLRSWLGKSDRLRVIREAWGALVAQFGMRAAWRGLGALAGFAREYREYKTLNADSPFQLRGRNILPCLTDRTEATPIEPTYFLQDAWCARKIAERLPARHYDVASSARSMSVIAQFVPVTFVDIRPVEIALPRFDFVAGSVLDLPFKDRSVPSLSSLCVIEHIGLSRYGDPMDAAGSEKAAAELCRVLAPGGDLYVSVPVDSECRIYFNAHRAFTREYLLSLFSPLTLDDERYIYGRAFAQSYAPDRGFGTGLYHFRRP